jgi:DNA-binding NarL/FixJ family response regulator
MTISVLVADDQPMIRSGLVALLNGQPDLVVVAEASDGSEAVELARQHEPDVVIMDLRMPGTDGVSATRELCADRSGPTPRVLVLTTFHLDEDVYGALRAGASGYLLKQAVPADLFAAVRRVAGGDAWLDPGVAGRVIDALSTGPAPGPTAATMINRLTARELEVLLLLAEGCSNAEIADRLVVGQGTVKTHVSNVLTKTGSRDRAQAIAVAYRSGLIVAGQPTSPSPGLSPDRE